MLRNDCPYKFKIDPEVLVDGHISEPDYLRPGDLRVSFAHCLGYAQAGLSEQRQTVQYRALND